MHRELYKGNNLYGKLIYFDKNFSNYFNTILTIKEFQQTNYVFGIFDKKDLAGFIHLKKIETTLFLNNIFIRPEFRGRGIGKLSLCKALNTLKNLINVNFDFFELEVFESNVSAYNFYKNIGLKKIQSYNWYTIYEKNNYINSCNFLIGYDLNNFKSIFLDETKVGTIVNDQFIIVHDSRVLKINSEMIFVYKILADINELAYNWQLIESSQRMRIPFNSLII